MQTQEDQRNFESILAEIIGDLVMQAAQAQHSLVVARAEIARLNEELKRLSTERAQ